MKLRDIVASRLTRVSSDIEFANGRVRAGGTSRPLLDAVSAGELVAEDVMEAGDLGKRFAQRTFAAHFVEVGVHAGTGETRVRRMLAVCASGRTINPTAAQPDHRRMTMGVGAALMENLVVDKRVGFSVNHDLASYEVPVHADIPEQEVIFLDEVDSTVGLLKRRTLANSVSAARRRRWLMQSITPPASVSGSIRSPSTSCCRSCPKLHDWRQAPVYR